MLVRTLVHIPEDHLEQLSRIAESKQVSRAVVVRWAITEYLKSFYLPACPVEGTKEKSKDLSVERVEAAA
jgi:hypothetical protein